MSKSRESLRYPVASKQQSCLEKPRLNRSAVGKNWNLNASYFSIYSTRFCRKISQYCNEQLSVISWELAVRALTIRVFRMRSDDCHLVVVRIELWDVCVTFFCWKGLNGTIFSREKVIGMNDNIAFNGQWNQAKVHKIRWVDNCSGALPVLCWLPRRDMKLFTSLIKFEP